MCTIYLFEKSDLLHTHGNHYVNFTSVQNISPRMKVWGTIVEVNRKDLVVSLPGGLRGFVQAEEVADMLTACGNKV